MPRDAPWRVGRTLATGNGTRHVYARGLFEAVRRSAPDVIDLFEEPFSLVALQTLFARAVFARRAALVVYSAVNVSRTWRAPYRWIERLVLRWADGAHAPNGDVPPIFARAACVEPVDVIPLGVDVGRFDARANAPARDAATAHWFRRATEPVKGLDVLLDAYRRLARQQPGHRGRRARAPALRRDAATCLRAVPYDAVPGLLKSLDVLVLPSVTILPLHREQFGRVLVEAMAAGVPVVGSSSGAIPEVIGDAGLVVPERDPAALAEAIDRVLSDATLRERLIDSGRAVRPRGSTGRWWPSRRWRCFVRLCCIGAGRRLGWRRCVHESSRHRRSGLHRLQPGRPAGRARPRGHRRRQPRHR